MTQDTATELVGDGPGDKKITIEIEQVTINEQPADVCVSCLFKVAGQHLDRQLKALTTLEAEV